MVRNRTFQDHGFGGLARWYLDNKGTARGAISYDGNEGPSAALPGSMMFDIKSADAQNPAGVRNEGWWAWPCVPTRLTKARSTRKPTLMASAL